jgi:hypothetical protein
VKEICRYLPLLSLLSICVPFASAQSSVDFGLGFGTVHDKANGGGIDSASSANAYGACIPGPSDPFCQANPSLGGFFLGIGGDVMLTKLYGFGAEVNLMPAQSNYGPLQYRQTFFDVNGVLAPVNTKRAQLQLQAGIGVAHTSFTINQSGCVGTVVCSYQNLPVGTSNHFQIHAGVGISLFVTEHVFIRPQFDIHYVPGFTDQFGSNLAPGGSIWLGYNFGDRQ